MDNEVDNRGTIHTFSINNHGTTVMARPVTVTKERILSASLDLVRSGGLPLLTARNLCAKPRYIQDEEWAELERMLRNSFSLTPESLRELPACRPSAPITNILAPARGKA